MAYQIWRFSEVSKPLHDTLELCDHAAGLLRTAGFVHHQTSMSSETVYYRLPGRHGLLRLSSHSRKNGPGYGSRSDVPVVATITFNGLHCDPPGKMKMAEGKIEQVVAQAIGRYMIKTRPA